MSGTGRWARKPNHVLGDRYERHPRLRIVGRGRRFVRDTQTTGPRVSRIACRCGVPPEPGPPGPPRPTVVEGRRSGHPTLPPPKDGTERRGGPSPPRRGLEHESLLCRRVSRSGTRRPPARTGFGVYGRTVTTTGARPRERPSPCPPERGEPFLPSLLGSPFTKRGSTVSLRPRPSVSSVPTASAALPRPPTYQSQGLGVPGGHSSCPGDGWDTGLGTCVHRRRVPGSSRTAPWESRRGAEGRGSEGPTWSESEGPYPL